MIDSKSLDMKRNHFFIRRVILILLLCIVSSSIIAQKVNLDTLTVDELNLYTHKAVKLRNAGMILTFSGVSIVAAGYITSVIWSNTTSLEGWDVFMTLIPFAIGGVIGIPTAIIGIPLWLIGGSKNAKAEIALKKFNIVPENSMALGLGITFRF